MQKLAARAVSHHSAQLPCSIAQHISYSAFEYRQIDIIGEHRVLTISAGKNLSDVR
jgi:hypothetical protein